MDDENNDILIQDTIQRIIGLNARVDKLEKRVLGSEVESASSYSDNQSSSDKGYNEISSVLPKIKAKIENDRVIISIQCLKTKDSTLKIMRKVKRIGLSTLTLNVLPCGESFLNITIVAKMKDELEVTMIDLVANLQEALSSNPFHN